MPDPASASIQLGMISIFPRQKRKCSRSYTFGGCDSTPKVWYTLKGHVLRLLYVEYIFLILLFENSISYSRRYLFRARGLLKAVEDRKTRRLFRKDTCAQKIHSHSIVAGGLPVISYTTRLMPSTSVVMRAVTRSSRS